MSSLEYPESLEIQPCAGPVSGVAVVPGSKSITNRALILAALGSRWGSCILKNALESEDTLVMAEALRAVGFEVVADPVTATIAVGRNTSGRIIPALGGDLFLANSGTSIRFLTAMLSLGQGCYTLDGVARMRERPIRDLLDALRMLGVQAVSMTGCPPVTLRTFGWQEDTALIRAGVSSQYLSALLLAAPFAGKTITLKTEGVVVSEPYIEMTLRMMADFGLKVERTAADYVISPADGPGLREYTIEPDASAASYFLALPAIVGGTITVPNLSEQSLQGDVRFARVLEQMGCRVEFSDAGITVHGSELRGIDIDMNDISDTVMTLGAVACFAAGPTTIRNIAHIRHKETDRISALATELRKVGATVEEREDGLTITPGPLRAASIATYNDHRMAMSLALIGLRTPGIVIENPGCVGKTYPRFWEDLESVIK